ncbi:unnamed protein product [Urochloa decumbens]|uniref:Uncharacterized protein n=1 Tax=Urochloa decumbens TaxID=240449 RepID=A0ABC9DYP5_9POAL
MVVALGPGRFYGSSLPRPRFFPGDRVDPPVPVTDALLAWAEEAHWSMGGLAVKRLRLQGRIEGSIDKLRRRDARAKARVAGHRPASLAALGSDDDEASDGDSDEEEAAAQEKILKRELLDDDEDSDESEEEEEEGDDEPLATIAATAAKKKRARKLSDEFDRIALQQQLDKKQKAAPARTSPRRQSSAPAAKAPARASPKRKASAPAAGAPARASPRRKAAVPAAASAPVGGARRTSPRNKN